MDVLKEVGWKNILWFALLIILPLIGAVTDTANPNRGATGGLTIWGIITFFRVAKAMSKWDWTWLRNGIRWILTTGLAVALLSTVAYAVTRENDVPTETKVWQAAVTTLGLPTGTGRPERRAEVTELVRQGLCLTLTKGQNKPCPDFPGRDEAVDKLSDRLFHNDTAGFNQEFAETVRSYAQWQVQRSGEAFTVKTGSIGLVAIVTVLCALIAVFLSYPIEGIGKITGTVVWALLAAFIYLGFFVGTEGQPVARELLVNGFWVKAGAFTLSAFGVGVGFAAADVKVESGFAKILVKLFFAGIGSLLGLGLDSLLQTQILTSAVTASAGQITLDQAFVMYQLGSLAGGGLTGMVSGALLISQAVLIMPKDWRG